VQSTRRTSNSRHKSDSIGWIIIIGECSHIKKSDGAKEIEKVFFGDGKRWKKEKEKTCSKSNALRSDKQWSAENRTIDTADEVRNEDQVHDAVIFSWEA